MSAFVENVSSYPSDEVESIVLWTLGQLAFAEEELRQLVVRVLNGNQPRHSGTFYDNCRSGCPRVWARTGATYPQETRHLLACCIGTDPVGRRYDRGLRGGPPPLTLWSWQEDLVCIVAHEGWHYFEYLTPDRKIKWSEVRAEWTEYHLLCRFQEGEIL